MLIQIRDLNPVTAPIWLAGLAAFAFWRRLADLRAFAIAFVVLLIAMMALHAKSYYPSGACPVLFAGGAVALEAWIASQRLRAALTVVAVALAFPSFLSWYPCCRSSVTLRIELLLKLGLLTYSALP